MRGYRIEAPRRRRGRAIPPIQRADDAGPSLSKTAEPAKTAERILLIRLGALGDVVRTTACLPALRGAHPRARLAWLVEEGAAGALRSRPELDRVLLFPRRELVRDLRRGRWPTAVRRLWRFVAELRAEQFDLVIDFHSIARSALLSRATGAGRRLGLAPPHGRELSWWLASQRVQIARAKLSRFERNSALLEAAGVRGAGAGWSSPPRARTPGCVILHPGSSGAAAHKRYPPQRYGEVASGLVARYGSSVQVAYGPGERELAESIVRASGGAAALAPETKDVDALAASLAGAEVFVGSDSGPLHIASMVGTPVVQLLGPTDAIENEPWAGTAWRRVSVPLACRPCRRGCEAATCMREIAPDSVVEAVGELLSGVAPA